MKIRYDSIFWGILLILAGGLVFAQQQGWVQWTTPLFWALAFAALGVIFFIRYLLAGLREWGWLFPALILPAVGSVIWLGTSSNPQPWIAAPIFGAIAIPFLVVFALDYRRNWWALIPAGVMVFLVLMLIFINQESGDVIGAAIMFVIAIPFLIVYLRDHSRWWALIPAFVMASIGVLILLTLFFGDWAGAFVPIAISLPFFYVYFTNPQRWWALIPAGVMASIGVNAFLSMPALGKFGQSSLPAAIMFLGWAATFYWLWRQREKVPTAWAYIPAMVMGILAAVLLVTGAWATFGLPAALLAAGLLIIYLSLRPKKNPVQ
jgi:hypothetical protein